MTPEVHILAKIINCNATYEINVI